MPVPLPQEEVVAAMGTESTVLEKQAEEYFAGYCFHRLLNFHQEECETCNKHGSNELMTTENVSGSSLFLFLKRYNTSNARLYKCSPLLLSYISCLTKIASHCFEKHMEKKGIVKLICTTAKKYLENVPALCSSAKSEKFASLVARTVIVYHLKWKNRQLSSSKKTQKRKTKHHPQAAKLSKLTHM